MKTIGEEKIKNREPSRKEYLYFHSYAKNNFFLF